MWILLLAFVGCDRAPEGNGGSALCNVDADGDGFGTTETKAASSCTDEGVADNHDDCDDGAASTHPGATETAGDGIDQDCDGDDLCFRDDDGDGFGSEAPGAEVPGCEGKGVAATSSDCDDGDIAVHPGADEIPGDAIDQDCDGGEICYADSDGDGFGTSILLASADMDCADEGEAGNPDDCLDAGADGPATFPGAAEYESGSECMTDADGDGYGSSSPAKGVTPGTDCDDGDTDQCPEFHIGYDVEFPRDDLCVTVADYMMGVLVTLPSMTVAALGHIAHDSTGNFRMALYTDDDGPDALVVEAGPETLVDGVQELPVSYTPISAGDYWIMTNYDSVVPLPCALSGSHGSAYPQCRWRDEIPFDGPMPDPFGASEEGAKVAWNYYVVGY